MKNIENLQRKKAEIVSDHIRRCKDGNLSKAEQWVLKELDYEINCLKKGAKNE